MSRKVRVVDQLRAIRLARQGHTYRDVAARFGVTHPTIGEWLKAHKNGYYDGIVIAEDQAA